MKLKLDAEGRAVLADGKPVYVHDDGKEAPFDAAAAVAAISARNAEAKTHRERAEAAEAKLKAFDGIEDAEAARRALGVVKNLDDKKLVDAGEVERVKGEAIRAVEEKYKPVVKKAEALEARLRDEVIGGSFARSKYIAEKLAVPLPMVEATFGQHFTLDGDRLLAKDAAGNPIYSRERPGELASFDEALETLVGASPFRDSILKGSGASGSGAGGNAGGAGGKATLNRVAFDALSPAARAAHVKAGGTVTD